MNRIRTAALAAFIAAGAIASALPANASAFFGWRVANVASWDVLNVRAWPASASQVLVGYPNGTALSLTGKCTGNLNLDQINGWPKAAQAAAVRYRWCEVWVDPLGNGNFRAGWVYGRYIRPL
ncbi:MAG: SH3 domain-containing protein [Bauldia sp.]|nr:SH3 domain-containing protein [Bauldia sp.]